MIRTSSRAADGLTPGPVSKTDTTTSTTPKPRKDPGTYQGGLEFPTPTTSLEIANEQYQSASASLEDSLCDSYSKISFELRPYSQCNCHGSMVTGSTIGTTLSNKNCPSCRLITRLISFYPAERRTLPESQITLWVVPYRMDSRTKLSQTDEITLPRCIEVHLCMHGYGKEDKWIAKKMQCDRIVASYLKKLNYLIRLDCNGTTNCFLRWPTTASYTRARPPTQ